MKIVKYAGITNTPAQLFALRAHVELFELGLTDGTTNPPAWDDNAILALVSGKPIGVLIWAKSDWAKTIIVRLGYVTKSHRGRGVYKKLWEELLKIAKEEKFVHIDGATSVKNTVMQKIMGKFDRKAFAIFYRYEVGNDEATR